ncbi:hypothetical protein E2C01_003295 [Portunus trituberculatus]|uniref:Uncharacterized protein n=1 Tax=Portunus trituberculatus TaxID=210409 RepID=A0A5B7CQQ0_PORTR|nr:hypothetical protein [Portunus trituberculatus]
MAVSVTLLIESEEERRGEDAKTHTRCLRWHKDNPEVRTHCLSGAHRKCVSPGPTIAFSSRTTEGLTTMGEPVTELDKGKAFACKYLLAASPPLSLSSLFLPTPVTPSPIQTPKVPNYEPAPELPSLPSRPSSTARHW